MSALDLVLPRPGMPCKASSRQHRRQHRRQHIINTLDLAHSIYEGEPVRVSNFGRGPKWIPGWSVRSSDTMVDVSLRDGRQVHRHADHVCSRPRERSPSPSRAQDGLLGTPGSPREGIQSPGTMPSDNSSVPSQELTPVDLGVRATASPEAIPITPGQQAQYPVRTRYFPKYYGDYVTEVGSFLDEILNIANFIK